MFDSVLVAVGSSFERAPWGWGLLALLVGGYFKLKPVLVELANKRERDLLEERAEEMASMRERMERLEEKLAAAMTRLAIAEEETRSVRHDLASTDQLFGNFLDRVRAKPNDAAAIASVVADEWRRAKDRAERERVRLAELRSAALAKQVSAP